MQIPILSLTLALALIATRLQAPNEAGAFDHEHKAFTQVLTEHVRGDRVDYAALKKEPLALAAYTAGLESLGAAEFGAWSREQRYAFWINAYNAYTLSVVIDHYPVASIRDIKRGAKDVWDIEFIALGKLAPGLSKERLSLNDIEHEILRKEFKDARVHAAVNCASKGCPPLANRAFEAPRLDEQLTDQVRAWLGDGERNVLDRERACIEVSKIFEWFGEDFERDAGGVREWVQKYAPPAAAEWLGAAKAVKVRYLDYSWDLNDVE